MIQVDIAALEVLADRLMRCASQTEETVCRLRHVSAEMQEDVELAVYEPSGAALESVVWAVEALGRADDTLQSLKNVVASLGERYRALEQEHKNALGRMLTVMDTATVGYQAAMQSDTIPQVGHDEELAAHNAAEQLVADSAEELRVANVAAIRQAAQAEYGVQDVRDL